MHLLYKRSASLAGLHGLNGNNLDGVGTSVVAGSNIAVALGHGSRHGQIVIFVGPILNRNGARNEIFDLLRFLLSNLFNADNFGGSQERRFSFCTGKSLSEAHILGSTNPQYDKRLFIDLPVQYMKTTSSEHGENMLCTQHVHVHGKSMNNLFFILWVS